MTPEAFISKWKAADLKERSAAQEHFIDLCHMLGEPTPAEVDPKGEWYCFERGATKTTGGKGWADVWKRGHFGWEYKGRGKDLNAAFSQLQQYAIALENPPLLVVCDLDRFRIHTNWNNTVSAVHEIALDDIREPAARKKLKAVLSNPEQLRPGQTRKALTEKAAADFARLAQRLRDRGHTPETVAHFINRLVFCMFAEDIGLLPNKMFARMLDHAKTRPNDFAAMAKALFGAMRSGGMVGFEAVEWFNGGLFDDDTALGLDKEEIELALRVAALDWAEIDPTIFGTLFERGLDPDKRSQLGAHYTDRDKIMMIIEPVIVRPLVAEWEVAKKSVSEALKRAKTLKAASARTKAENGALSLYRTFLDRLRSFTVLDPACGSGNFLYLALLALKDLENRVMIEAEALGLQREFPAIGPASVKGLEINPYAAELARVTVWIGEIQWMRRNGFDVSKNPILKPLQTIECRDALMNSDGSEAVWPDADAIIGNPPFLGPSPMLAALGNSYIVALRKAYGDRVPGMADLVMFWFEKARAKVQSEEADRVGFVATNSIRGGGSRVVLDRIGRTATFTDVWADEPWVLDGAAVRVSIVCFSRFGSVSQPNLNGQPVSKINTDLSAGAVDLTTAVRLLENRQVAFIGTQKNGKFEVMGEIARVWLLRHLNPNGRSNADVVRPWVNGMDITRRPSDTWIVDFNDMHENEAALYEMPFEYVRQVVKPTRDGVRRERRRLNWWQHGEPAPGVKLAIRPLSRFIATARVAKHRIFVWLNPTTTPDCQVVSIARDDDCTFGILHSRFHEAWSLRLGTSLEDRPRYTPTTTFETFPFPIGLTPDLPSSNYRNDPRAMRIAAAAKRLDELRRNWLNPADLVYIEPEVVADFPDRVLPKNASAAAVLKALTLTNLYNERPTWLANAHAELDRAVAAAYGWPEDISTEDALSRLLELNRARAGSGSYEVEEDGREVA
ncbi:class I SAM-dependent DNA methyltransferase [Microvirga calopogonii]|uniref:class I SAM-dependent DNA methyltransferase n=1 Tax=Microvirga calopogonii TaxID=2078013 RepID=UPI000E0D30C6|nr:DNA methyltransferase [Microvirga calopogonii]